MRDIYFIVGKYMPKASANGICAHAIAKSLFDIGENVTVICYDDGLSISSYEGVTIRRIPVPLYIKDDIQSSLMKKVGRVDSLARKMIYLSEYPLRSRSLAKHYENAVIEEIERKQSEYFTVVSIVNPLETAIAGAELKKKYGSKCRAIYYCADTLSNEMGNESILSSEYRRKKGLEWEKHFFRIFDEIMIMEAQKKNYLAEQFREYNNKLKITNFPLLHDVGKKGTEENSSNINNTPFIVYTGTINKKLRDPTFLCNLLFEVCKDVDVQVCFLGSCDCMTFFSGCEKNSSGKIKHIGMQPYETAQNYINRADILLSIGNSKSHMAPSKIYEYMASGKPIIHTYTDEDDMCVPVLEQYGNAFLIKEHFPIQKETVENLKRFILNRNIEDFRIIKERFLTATPDYSASIIIGDI